MIKSKPATVSADRLKSLIERAERIIEERKAVQGDLRDIFTEAKGVGYNPKIMRRIIAERARDAADLAAEQDELDTYRHALGMAVDMVHGGLSLREAQRKTGVPKSNIHRALAVPEVSQKSAGPDTPLCEGAGTTDKPDGPGSVLAINSNAAPAACVDGHAVKAPPAASIVPRPSTPQADEVGASSVTPVPDEGVGDWPTIPARLDRRPARAT